MICLALQRKWVKIIFFLQNCTASSFSICNWKHLVIRSVFIPIPKKGNAKECSHYRTISLISHASKVMLKILKFTWTVNFQMFKRDLKNAEKPEIKLPTSTGSLKKQESSRKKTSISALLTMPKSLTVWITILFVKSVHLKTLILNSQSNYLTFLQLYFFITFMFTN